ncbi:hypothetical protein WOLCODRAFT_165186 [Wolfiporia cocos MD-104 SS10]|uniref:Nephrocystin 3-like N-terminal domain-containing protein n=1 Tax=Wolfiporia cocos (strain MD-104) TaxID=742152 RepID=A0A2H3K5Z3_WOLCO|nr:hypothetical protein WOLCODRAFT_165186 [Wolfiporia cocos MD-104 SS10]
MDSTERSREREKRPLAGDRSSDIQVQAATSTVPEIVVYPSEAPSGRGRPTSRFSRMFNHRSHSDGRTYTASSLASRSLSPAIDGASSSGRSSSAHSRSASPCSGDESSQNATQANTSCASSSKKKRRILSDQNADDALAVAQNLVKGLGACASLIPNVTGLDIVMSGLAVVLDRVAEARDNAKAVQNVTDNVTELVNAVISTFEQVSGHKIHTESTTASANIAAGDSSTNLAKASAAVGAFHVSDKLYSVDALQEAMKQLTIKVDGLKEEASTITKSRKLTQVVRSKQNASKLEEISQSIRDARDEFQTRAIMRIEIVMNDVQMTLNALSSTTSRTENTLVQIDDGVGRLERQVEAGVDRITEVVRSVDQKMDDFMRDNGVQAVLDRLPHRDHAEYRSAINEAKSGYLPGTRIDLLGMLEHWETAPDQPCIFILSGAAGTGKSTVAFELAKRLDYNGHLGASFFFVRGDADLSCTTFVIPTIAYQLARSQIPLRACITEHARSHLSRGSLQNMEAQVQDLIVRPLSGATADYNPVVVIVDALDECTDQALERVPRLLHLLLGGIRGLHIPIRVLLTARPELHIERVFETVEFKSITKPYRLEEVPQVNVDGDITLFFRDKLARLPSRDLLFNSRPNVVQDLTRRAGGLFIWAATTCRTLYNNSTRIIQLIEALLDNSASSAVVLNDLDRLYLTVLRSALPSEFLNEWHENRADMERVLGALALLRDHISPKALAALLDVAEEGILSILERLQSVAHYDQSDLTVPFRPLHASFPQFLVDRQRCQDTCYYISPHIHHARLAVACLKLLNTHPGFHRNILILKDPTVSLDAIDDLPSLVRTFMPPHIQYACNHWAYHLAEADLTSALVDELIVLCSCKLLVWIEASSILGKLDASAKSLVNAQTWSQEHGLSAASELLHDAFRFLLDSFSAIEDCPENIYAGVLPFIPECRLREKYSHHAPVLLSPHNQQWGACHRVIDYASVVGSVTFSPNGRWIASASDDRMVRMFDAVSGTTLNTMRGHTSEVMSVAVSPDSQFAVSGSRTGEINMWSTASGALTKLLWLPQYAGRIELVECIAYSPDGRTVVTGSRTNIATVTEGMLHIWDPDTGKCLQSTIVGSPTYVYSVAYSPDGASIATASHDGLVRTWESHTLNPKATFSGHNGTVRSVVFFPDGAKLASGSWDETIHIWDTTSAQCTRILEGHTGEVNSVAVSAKGNLIASGSDDCTIRLWDTQSGDALAILKGHSSLVWSIGFSSEGDHLVSGSGDGTVRVWDLQAVAKQSNSQLMGHAAQPRPSNYTTLSTLVGAIDSRPSSFGYLPLVDGVFLPQVIIRHLSDVGLEMVWHGRVIGPYAVSYMPEN